MKKTKLIVTLSIIFLLLTTLTTSFFLRQAKRRFTNEPISFNKQVYENAEVAKINYKIKNNSIFKYKVVKGYQKIVDFKIYETDTLTNQTKVIYLAPVAFYGVNEIIVKPYQEFTITYELTIDVTKEYTIQGVASFNFSVDYLPQDYGITYVNSYTIKNGIVYEGDSIGII